MKNLFFLLFFLVLIYSCENTNKNKTESKDVDTLTEKTEPIEIKYLEDFLKFKNHQEMSEFFGEENVKKDTMGFGEEGIPSYYVTILNPECRNSVFVAWGVHQGYDGEVVNETDSAVFVMTKYVFLDVDDSAKNIKAGEIYPTKHNVKLGTKITELKEINGKEFNFYGLAWDYGGLVSGLDEKFDNYTIFLGYKDAENKYEYPVEYQNILGDTQFSSENKDAIKLGLEVMYIGFNPEN